MRIKKLIVKNGEKLLSELEGKMEKGMICDMENEMEMFIGKRVEFERILKVKIEKEFGDEFDRVIIGVKLSEEGDNNWYWVINGCDVMLEIEKVMEVEME